jgi:hypothetical protein
MPGWLNDSIRTRRAFTVLVFLTLLSPSAGSVLFVEDFEDDLVGHMPLIGAGRWNTVSQGGGGCVNKVVDAATSHMGSGLAVYIKDPSSTSGNLLLEYDDIGSRDMLRLSFQFYENPGATGVLTIVLGGSRGAAHFAELQVGAGHVIAKRANGSSDVDSGGGAYVQGETAALIVAVNSGSDAITYTLANGPSGSLTLAGDRYDVYVGSTLVIDDADPADYSGPIDSFSFQTTAAGTGVDVYVDNIRVETLDAGPVAPDFSVTITPSQQPATRCRAVTFDVTVSAEGGFAAPVYLSATMLPPGTTAQFSSAVITASGTSQLTLVPPHTLTPGTYPFGVQATGGGKTHVSSASFAVTSDPLPQFSLSVANATGHGTVTLDPPGGLYDCGTVVKLTAASDEGYCLKSWSGTDKDSSTATSNNATMKADRTVTVEFALDCNKNGVPDATDIAKKTSKDCDGNGEPDECQPDTDKDGAIDVCDDCPGTPEGVKVNARGCPLPSDADYDRDGDVDIADFLHLQACFNGPNRSMVSPDCTDLDFDADMDVDLTDFGYFQACYNGPNRPPACK